MKKELDWIIEWTKANNIQPKQAKGKDYCKRLNENWECDIYEVRPKVCRIYGTKKHPMLTCPKFPEEAVKPMTQDDADYQANVNNDPAFF